MVTKITIIYSLLFLSGCMTQTTRCYDLADAQYNEVVRRSGKDAAQIWRLKSDNPEYKYHHQVKELRNGKWYWLPNTPYTVPLETKPQGNCQIIGRVK